MAYTAGSGHKLVNARGTVVLMEKGYYFGFFLEVLILLCPVKPFIKMLRCIERFEFWIIKSNSKNWGCDNV